MLEKRDTALASSALNKHELAYVHRKETDLLFWKTTAGNSVDISWLGYANIQTKNSLEKLKSQINQDISQLRQKKLCL